MKASWVRSSASAILFVIRRQTACMRGLCALYRTAKAFKSPFRACVMRFGSGFNLAIARALMGPSFLAAVSNPKENRMYQPAWIGSRAKQLYRPSGLLCTWAIFRETQAASTGRNGIVADRQPPKCGTHSLNLPQNLEKTYQGKREPSEQNCSPSPETGRPARGATA